MLAGVAVICASDEPFGARTFSCTQSPLSRFVTLPTVGTPCRQTRISVPELIANDWLWLWPSILRSAGRLPPSTCSCTEVELAPTSSPRNWKSWPLPPAAAEAATVASATVASARTVSRRCFIFVTSRVTEGTHRQSPAFGSPRFTERKAQAKHRSLVPGRRVVHPAARDHRCDDLRVEVVPR